MSLLYGHKLTKITLKLNQQKQHNCWAMAFQTTKTHKKTWIDYFDFQAIHFLMYSFSMVQHKVIKVPITCHFLTMEHILSRVRSMPWKLVRQFFPWTSSVMSLNLRKATSSFCRSARLTSNTRPFRPSEAIPGQKQKCVGSQFSCSPPLSRMLHQIIYRTTFKVVFIYQSKRGQSPAPAFNMLWIQSIQELDLLVPWVLVTKVLPRLRMLNIAGALTSYQSFLEKGSTL